MPGPGRSAGSLPPAGIPADVAELAVALRDATASLDAIIADRARQMAEPVIAAAREAAELPAAEARADAQRWKDVNTELGRRIAALERQLGQWREIARDPHAALLVLGVLVGRLGGDVTISEFDLAEARALAAIARDGSASGAIRLVIR